MATTLRCRQLVHDHRDLSLDAATAAPGALGRLESEAMGRILTQAQSEWPTV